MPLDQSSFRNFLLLSSNPSCPVPGKVSGCRSVYEMALQSRTAFETEFIT